MIASMRMLWSFRHSKVAVALVMTMVAVVGRKAKGALGRTEMGRKAEVPLGRETPVAVSRKAEVALGRTTVALAVGREPIGTRCAQGSQVKFRSLRIRW